MAANPEAAHPEEHAHSATRYHLTLLALLVGTALTVGAYEMHFGEPMAFIVAMVIAIVKASCVILFFMHLWGEKNPYPLIFVTSIFFVFVLIFFVAADVSTRFPLARPAPANELPAVEEPETAPDVEGHSPRDNDRPETGEQGVHNTPKH
jgi:caa(3)-type oxidase subunit IV